MYVYVYANVRLRDFLLKRLLFHPNQSQIFRLKVSTISRKTLSEDRSILIVIINMFLLTVSSPPSKESPDCWTTGCQPHSWKVVGCDQYQRTERDKFPCPGGYNYMCCTANTIANTAPAPRDSGKSNVTYCKGQGWMC